MTAIPTGLAIKSNTPAERAVPQGVRLALAGLLAQTAPGVAAPGRLYAPSDAGGEPLSVTGHATLMKYVVNKGVAAIPRAGQGVYLVANPTQLTIDTTAANATYPRLDRIYIAQPDPELGDTGVARVDVVQGTAVSLTPALPNLPAGAYELARKQINAGVTNTTTGPAFTDIAPITRANAALADGDVVTAKLADGSVTNAKLASSGLDGSKITTGTIPATVTSLANHTGKIQGRTWFIQQADPAGSAANGDLWDSW